MTDNAGTDVSEIRLIPLHDGLRGPAIALNRDDIEAAMARNAGSPPELWQHARFDTDNDPDYNRFTDSRPWWQRFVPWLHLDNQVSLADRDKGLFYYSSAVFGLKHQIGAHVIGGTAIRLNIANNLQDLQSLRPLSLNPVRSDIGGFAARPLGLDRLYSAWLTSLTPDWHVAATAGYLEQMYSGGGGEILYRPFGKTYAFGAESWAAFKRDYRSPLALSPTGQGVLTGFLSAYYEVPTTDMTVGLKVGRYLAGDVGGTLFAARTLRNGVRISGFVTATDRADVDAYGTGTNLYSGLRLSIPLGGLPLLPRASDLSVTAAPLGRNAGQMLDTPLPLYEETEPLSYRALDQHWTDVTQ